MSLRKAVSFGAVQTVASMAVSFLSVKITSVYLGPAGVGLLGQMQHFVNLVLGVVVAGLKNGVVRRTAELKGDAPQRAVVVSTVLRLVIAIGLPVAVGVAVFSRWLADELLHDRTLSVAILLFGVLYVFGLVGTLMLACANGAKDFKSTTGINISVAVVNLGLFAALCPTLGLLGALLSVASMPLVTLLAAGAFARRAAWWPGHPWRQAFSKPEAGRALGFIPAAALGAIATPLIHIVLRDGLATRAGAAAVGLVQGITRLSDLYLGIVVSVFSMYFLPRFAEIRQPDELKRELLRALALIIPALAVLSFAMYLLRDLVISLIFTREFAGMRDLFAWQMAGNVFKMIGWLFGYVMMAKAHPMVLAAYEMFALLVWWRLGVVLIAENGAVGSTQAYALTYAVYSVMGVIAAAVIIGRMRRNEEGTNAQ